MITGNKSSQSISCFVSLCWVYIKDEWQKPL